MTGMPRIDGLTILIAIFIIAAIIIVALGLRALFHDPGERALPRRDSGDGRPPPEYYTAPPYPAPYGPVMKNLRYKYGTLGDNSPAPFERDFPAPAAAALPPSQAPPPPVIHHDEYAPTQRWHRRTVTVTRHHLPSVTGPAIVALEVIATGLQAHLDAKEAAFHAEAMAVFPPWKKWPGDDTLTNMRAVGRGA